MILLIATIVVVAIVVMGKIVVAAIIIVIRFEPIFPQIFWFETIIVPLSSYIMDMRKNLGNNAAKLFRSEAGPPLQ